MTLTAVAQQLPHIRRNINSHLNSWSRLIALAEQARGFQFLHLGLHNPVAAGDLSPAGQGLHNRKRLVALQLRQLLMKPWSH